MTDNPLGILHPGEMGASIAAAAVAAGSRVYWASEGRSAASAARAARAGLQDAGSLDELARLCPVLLSVCPPEAAEAQSAAVLAAGFRGLYVDLNAIAPQRAARMAQAMQAAGAEFVDGGIIGGPAWQPGTVAYLSGLAAGRAAACFAGSLLETVVLGPEIGKASALKMVYAAYSKGSTALLLATLAAAEALDVRADLQAQWASGDGELAAQAEGRARRATAKAWRFSGEMEEIAATFEAAGLPGGAYHAAAELFQRLAGFKGAEPLPRLDEVLAALIEKKP